MKRLLAATALIAAAVMFAMSGLVAAGCASSDPVTGSGAGDAILAQAFEERSSDLQLEGRGTVVRILADDTEGGRHQRFIVRLASGQTLLIAHNIDIAPRVEGLREGDTVAFRGVYEWSEEGGTVHWTHHDPDGEHAPGWVRHGGRTYQ